MSNATLDMRPPEHDDVQVDSDGWVRRFGLTERFAHWWTVLMVATALLSGLGLGDDSESGSPMLTVHIAAVALIGAGLLVALVFGNTRALLHAIRRLFIFDRRDVAWARFYTRHPFRRGVHHEWGMFNPAQKLLAWALSISIAAVIITGIQAWSAGGDDSGGPHGAMVVVAMTLVGSHIFMAVVNPTTRPALAGMVLGRVRRSWAAKHHGGWLHDLDR